MGTPLGTTTSFPVGSVQHTMHPIIAGLTATHTNYSIQKYGDVENERALLTYCMIFQGVA
jgi:hypothetical protein